MEKDYKDYIEQLIKKCLDLEEELKEYDIKTFNEFSGFWKGIKYARKEFHKEDGCWKAEAILDEYDTSFVCKDCGWAQLSRTNYCPNCGRYMHLFVDQGLPL